MKNLGLGFWERIRLEWHWTLTVRKLLYNDPALWKRIRSIHGPGMMGWLRSVVQLALELGSEFTGFTSRILRGLAFSLASRSLNRRGSPDTTIDWPDKQAIDIKTQGPTDCGDY